MGPLNLGGLRQHLKIAGKLTLAQCWKARHAKCQHPSNLSMKQEMKERREFRPQGGKLDHQQYRKALSC